MPWEVNRGYTRTKMQDSNFWFYTLSAIPQTLAAMFALIIAVLVYRLEANDRVIERDIAQSKDFLFPIFPEIEIHHIEAMGHKEHLAKLEEALNLRLKENKKFLSLSQENYNRLFDIYKLKIREYHRFYDPDEKRIFSYLQQKKDSISIHIKSKKVISLSFLASSIVTSLTILLTLFFLPRYHSFGAPETVIKWVNGVTLFNVFLITASVIVMVFTERLLSLYKRTLKEWGLL